MNALARRLDRWRSIATARCTVPGCPAPGMITDPSGRPGVVCSAHWLPTRDAHRGVTRARVPTWVGVELPPVGLCGRCGALDGRHRQLDDIARRLHTGEDPGQVARDHRVSYEFAVCVGAAWTPIGCA